MARGMAWIDFLYQMKTSEAFRDTTIASVRDSEQIAELQGLLGELFCLNAQWCYFHLGEGRVPPTFPVFRRPAG